MDSNWKQKNLGGGGLQSANIRLARLLKRRRTAYALLLLFPLGAHRFYLEDRRGAVLYCLGFAAVILSLMAGVAPVTWVSGGMLIGTALLDIWWIEKAVVRINKRLRIEVYMSETSGPPAGYQGRFADGATGADDAAPEARGSSFAEQERRLRESAAERDRRRQ